MPDFIENQLYANVEHQNISGLFEDWLTRDRIAKNACCKTHGENANPDTHHHHPDLIGKRNSRHDIVNTKDQVHYFNGQYRWPKRLGLNGLEIFISFTTTTRHTHPTDPHARLPAVDCP